jgi:hypothetical protein
VNFADHGIPADADFGGDLTARQPGAHKAFELIDTFIRPRRNRHKLPPHAKRQVAADLAKVDDVTSSPVPAASGAKPLRSTMREHPRSLGVMAPKCLQLRRFTGFCPRPGRS